MKGTQIKVKENQEVNRSPGLRRMLSITIVKYMGLQSEYLKLKNKGEDDKSNSFSMVGVVEEKYDCSEHVLEVSVSNNYFNNVLVLNFACTFHICLKRD